MFASLIILISPIFDFDVSPHGSDHKRGKNKVKLGTNSHQRPSQQFFYEDQMML